MSDEAATLARAFARTLEDLRDRFEHQYIGAGAMPGPRPSEAVEDETPRTAEPSVEPGPEVRRPDAEPTRSSAAPARATEAAPSAPRGPAPSTAAADARRAPPSRPVQQGRRPEPSPPAKQERRSEPSRPADARDLSIADPAQSERAAKARSAALREQAKTWSPATKLEFLRRRSVGDCTRCPLARTRNRIVFGVGNPEADLMFVGEAPGADEDRQGEPFVGRAGQLLNRWLHELELRREDVYIANVLKCRPPGNRDPRPEEVDRCSPFLQAQIRAIEPKVIVALGRHAGMLLSRREDMTLRAMRSTSRLVYDAGAPKDDPTARMRIPLVVTYHPAYVLRQEGDGRRVPDGRSSPTEMVMTDLRRALAIIDDANA